MIEIKLCSLDQKEIALIKSNEIVFVKTKILAIPQLPDPTDIVEEFHITIILKNGVVQELVFCDKDLFKVAVSKIKQECK